MTAFLRIVQLCALVVLLFTLQIPVKADDAAKALRVAVAGRPPGLGNPYSTLPIGAINPMHLLYDALTMVGEEGAILPALAVSWEHQGDDAWVFQLRPDITFSNGEVFNAQTVVDVVTYLRSEAAAGYPRRQ